MFWRVGSNLIMPGAPGGPRRAPARALSTGRMALNLAGVTDYGTSQPFINVMKTAREQGFQAGGGTLDADGYPATMDPGARYEWLILWDLPEASTSLNGRYRLTWDGAGTMGVAGRVSGVVTGANQIDFDLTTGGSGTYVRALTLPISNVRVVHHNHLASFDAGAMFRPEWMRVIQGHQTVRFMNWLATNGSRDIEWANRTQLSNVTWAATGPGSGYGDNRGVPWEACIRLANETGMQPWFCIPHRATENYSRSAAALVRDTLDPALSLHLEYSNEIWNFSGDFRQTHWLYAQAGDITGNPNNWMQLGGVKAAEHMTWWADEFGAGASRINRIAGVHPGWQGLQDEFLDAPWFVANQGATAPVGSFDTLATTAYVGGSLSSDAALRTETQTRLTNDGLEATVAWGNAYVSNYIDTTTTDQFEYWFGVAAARQKALTIYEGGTHVEASWTQDPDIIGFYVALNDSPGMGANLEKMLLLYETYRRPQDGPFAQFGDIYNSGRFGSWGMMSHEDEYVDASDTNERHKIYIKYNLGLSPFSA